jgi:hypothetical protein
MICTRCNQEIVGGKPCLRAFEIAYPDEMLLPAIPYTGSGRCPDCGTSPECTHHECCDQEECPRCHGQLITCWCSMTERELRELKQATH